MSLVTIGEAAQPLWQIALVALGGAVVGGIFTTLGAWWERRETSGARREERAELRKADHRARQRQVAERLVREVVVMHNLFIDVMGAAEGALRDKNRVVAKLRGADASERLDDAAREEPLAVTGPLIKQLERYAVARESWLRGQFDVFGSAVLLDDATLAAEVADLVMLMNNNMGTVHNGMAKTETTGDAKVREIISDMAVAKSISVVVVKLGDAARAFDDSA